MEKARQNHQLIAVVLATAGVILFSVKAVFVKKVFQYQVDPISLLLMRMLMSLPFYLVIIMVMFIRKRKKIIIKWSYVPQLLTFGFLGYYMSSYLDFTGLQYISASLERLILFVYPTMVVILSALLYKTKISMRQVAGIIVAYFGVFLIYFQRSAMDSHSAVFTGSILILGCAFTYALYLVGSGSLIPQIGSALYTSLVMIVSTLGVILHYYVRGGDPKILSYPKEVYHLSIGLCLISTVLPSLFISEAIKRIGATRVAIIGSIGPVSTILLASIYLGERINAFQWIGSIIVISGVLLVNMAQEAKAKSLEIAAIEEQQGQVG
jgi:drug/metabolite transporter (DMT)-like permease